jgi:tetratricopeptide (TPR) repeat protein
MYEVAESDARLSIEKADAGYGDASFSRAKAYFRRGQAWFHLGNWDKAAEDYDTASALQPDNRQIVHRIEDLRKLRKTTCPCDNNHAWVWQQGKVCLEDVFGDPEEFYKCVEDWMSGTTLKECKRRAGLED